MRTLRRIRDWLGRGAFLLPGTACAAALWLGSASGQAQPPGAAEARTLEGKVQRMTTAPKGEIDGALLDDGTSLHWPPHLEDRFTRVVVQGVRVRATGRTETGPAGDVHFEVETVTNAQTNVRATNPDYDLAPPPRPGPRGPGRRLPPHLAASRRFDGADRQEDTKVTGTVKRMSTAPRGEIDGAVLEDGTWLHWPPHLQDRFVAAVKVGDQVRATGQTETGPVGDTHFEISFLTNSRTNQTVENPERVASLPSNGPRRDDAVERDGRLNDLARQIEQLQREIERLRQEK